MTTEAPPEKRTDRPAEQPAAAADTTAGKFYESAYNEFDKKLSEVPKTDAPAAAPGDTTPEQMKQTGWQPGDANADKTFKDMAGDLNSFDTAEAKVREAQTTGNPPAFKDTPNADGKSVKREYEGELKGYEHTFNKDGTVDLKTPTGEQIKFDGDKATITGPPPAPARELDSARAAELNAAFNKVGGKFSSPPLAEKGAWKLDAKGNTLVEKVPGIAEATMTIKPPNAKEDLKYQGEVKGTAEKPGYSTKATGDKATGYRTVDFDDSRKTAGDPTNVAGKPIEAFMAPRTGDKAPLTLVSDKAAGDGTVTTIGLDGSAETSYKPTAENNFKTGDKVYPPGHSEVVENRYDPAQHPDGLAFEKRSANGDSMSERRTKDGGLEVAKREAGKDSVVKYATPDDARAGKPAWSRETDLKTGVVTTNFPSGDIKRSELTPASAGPPAKAASVKLFGADAEGKPTEITDATKITDFLKNPPAVGAAEDLSEGRTRQTFADGRTVTSDAKTGVTKTETAANNEFTWNKDKPPSKEALAQITGLKAGDPRLDNVTSIQTGKGVQANMVRATYNENAENGKTIALIERDGSGNVLGEQREGTKEGRRYGQEINASGASVLEYEKKPNQKVGDQEVRDASGKLTQTRTSEGNVVKTTDLNSGRSETIDGDKGTWTVEEPGKPTESGLLKAGTDGRRLYFDKDNNFKSLQVTKGVRAGDNFSYQRDATGDLNKLDISTAPRDGKPAEKASLERDDKTGVWSIKPADGKVPGFPAADGDRNADGTFKGKFSTNPKGELTYETGDKVTKQIMRGDGTRDTFNMRDYSRVREDGTTGEAKKQYWDGYGSKENPSDGWREGVETKLPDGRTQVTFKDQLEGHPSKMIRDGAAGKDSFEVEFPNGMNYKIGNWADGSMSRTSGGKTETLYNTGTVGSDGRVQWAKGTPDATTGIVRFEDSRVASGELPAEAKIDKGTVTSRYADGSEVESDLNGNPKRIKPGHKGSQLMERRYGPNGDLKGFRHGSTTASVERANPADGTSDWNINTGGVDGQNHKIVDARVVEKPGGKFEVVGKVVGKDGVKTDARYESNGRLITKENGKDIVIDARGQKWTKSQEGTKGDTASTPPKPGTPPTWETGNPPKKFAGEIKLYDNGNIAIQTSADRAETLNKDGSTSKLDANGVERERTNPSDGTYQKRSEKGALLEFKSKNGDVTTLSYDVDPKGNPLGVNKVETKSAKDGTVRTEKRDNPQPPARAALRTEAGNEVTYDRMGTRTETSVKDKTSTTLVTDIRGNTRTITAVDGRATEVKGANLNGADTNLQLKYAADGKDPNPTEIQHGDKKYARVDGTANVYDVGGVPHTLEKDGSLKPTEDNAGIDPCWAQQRDARSAEVPRPEAPKKEMTLTEVDKILTDRYKLPDGAMKEFRTFAEKSGIGTAPGAMGAILDSAKEAGLLGHFTPGNLQAMTTELETFKAQNPEGVQQLAAILTKPDQLAALAADPVKLQQTADFVKAMLPEKLKPFADAKFVQALMKRATPPPTPGK